VQNYSGTADMEIDGRLATPPGRTHRGQIVMCCPMCFNDHLLIRRRSGWERVMIYLTQNRKYVCMSCAHAFRAPDRRSAPREQDETVLSHANKGMLRG
jgi:hypothetical protein